MRRLKILIDDRQAGLLFEHDKLWNFEYDPMWAVAADSFDLSPALRRSALKFSDSLSVRPVEWHFDNLLPEESLREAAANDAGLKDPGDTFALLECLGSESAGALMLLHADETPPVTGQLRPLEFADLSRRIDDLPKISLPKGSAKRMAIAGAQHKLLVNYEGGKLYEPVAATASTHILKPDHPGANRYPASVFNEYFTMKLAAAVGLPVPEVNMLYVPQPVYLVERFDRQQIEGNEPVRTHIVDACQLLNIARSQKYSAAKLESLNEIAALCTDGEFTRMQLFRWLTFNVLTANDDCHLKNLSFHVTPGNVTLAPHYDLLSTGAYWTKAVADENARWPNVPMAFALPGATMFGQVTRASLIEAAAVLQIPANIAKRYIDDMLRKAIAALPLLAEDLDKHRLKAPAEAASSLAMQQRLLAIIRNITFAHMSKALAA